MLNRLIIKQKMTAIPMFQVNNPYGFYAQYHPCNNNNTIDEIDNKTNHFRSPFDTKIVMQDSFRSEQERRKTFENWPLTFIDKNVLAEIGMFFTLEGDKVKCYFCGVEIGRWEETDHPVTEHMKWSPNCPLMRRRKTNNIPIDPDALDHILPSISYDVCGSNEIEIRPNAYAEGSISSSMTTTNSTSTYQIEYPEYAVEGARQRSFSEWPRTMKQKPKQLAEAGFFYAGIGDRVNCFSCGGGLKDWDENDEPWEQHARWLSKCRYVKLMKGQGFIDAVLAKHKLAAEKSQEACSTSGCSSDTESLECRIQTEGRKESTAALNVAVKTNVVMEKDDLLKRSESNSSTTSEKKIIPEEKLCKICYASEYSTAFLPCGHVVACAKCASSVSSCPLCRKPFSDVMRVYFS